MKIQDYKSKLIKKLKLIVDKLSVYLNSIDTVDKQHLSEEPKDINKDIIDAIVNRKESKLRKILNAKEELEKLGYFVSEIINNNIVVKVYLPEHKEVKSRNFIFYVNIDVDFNLYKLFTECGGERIELGLMCSDIKEISARIKSHIISNNL